MEDSTPLLLVPGKLAKHCGLGQPAGTRVIETKGRLVSLPGDRNTAAISPVALAVGAEERGVIPAVIRNIDDLGEAELFTLEQIRAPGQTQHQRSRGATAPVTQFLIGLVFAVGANAHRLALGGELGRQATTVADLVVVGEHPSTGCADPAECLEGLVDDASGARLGPMWQRGSQS